MEFPITGCSSGLASSAQVVPTKRKIPIAATTAISLFNMKSIICVILILPSYYNPSLFKDFVGSIISCADSGGKTVCTLTAPTVILQEAFLSFLGLGVKSPMASWGTLLNDGVQAMTVAPWLLVGPALFLVLTILSLNLLGDWLRDVLEGRRNTI